MLKSILNKISTSFKLNSPNTQWEEENPIKKIKKALVGLETFQLDLDTIKIDGFNWNENVPVDIYNKELDPNDPFLYRTFEHDAFRFKGKFHKNKEVLKFYSRLYIPINYKGEEKTYEFNLPIEHTKIRMQFYIQKQTTVYFDEFEGRRIFLLDFNFMENEETSFIHLY